MAIVEMHSSWLAINSVVGCTNNCKYCLLQATNNNCSAPKILVDACSAVDYLLDFTYYDEKIPLCLLPNTDAFLNDMTRTYLKELLLEISRRNIKNDLVIITKCKIADDVLELVKSMKENGYKIIFYISYSGLGKEVEPNIDVDILKNNFKILSDNNIDVIHYFRPFLPQNSDSKVIDEILNYVHKYTDVSVTTGLALIENFVDILPCWDEIKNYREEALKANCVWPEEAWNYFNVDYNHPQQVFQTNTCGLCTKLAKPSLQYYGTEECLNYNHCSEEQRARCREAHRRINQEEIIVKCRQLLKKLGFEQIEDVEFNFDEYGSLELKKIDLKISDAAYLSYILGVKVYISTNKIVKNTYNSSLNGAKPLILKRGVK